MMSLLTSYLFTSTINQAYTFVPHSASRSNCDLAHRRSCATKLFSSPFDNLLGGIFSNDDKDSNEISESNSADNEDEMSFSSFQQELTKRQQSQEESYSMTETPNSDEEDEFNGYDMRDIIYAKYGECFDVQFQRVDSYGVRAVYLVSWATVHFVHSSILD